MKYRSSNATGYTHFGGDLTANVNSSHGVQLTGGSTGGIVQPVGDDANITLVVRGKGTGGVVVGNSSSPVTLAAGGSVTVGAGSAVKGAYSTTLAYTFTALAAGTQEAFSIASTSADIMPGDLYNVELGSPAVSTQTISLIGTRTSTAASSRVTLLLGNICSTAIASTGSGTLRVTWFDLT